MTRQWQLTALVLGSLVLIGMWVDIAGYLDVFTNPAATGMAQEVAHYACYGGRVAMAGFFLAAPSFFARSTKRLLAPLLGCMVLGTVLFSFGFHQSLLDPLAVSAIGAALVGVAHIWAVSAVYLFAMGASSRRNLIVIIVGAQIAERLVVEVLNYVVPGDALIVVSYFLPIAAIALLAVALSISPRRQGPPQPPTTVRGAARRYYVALSVMAGVGLVACGATSATGIWGNAGNGQFTGEGASLLITAAECLTVVILCRITFATGTQRPLALRYQTSLLVLITGFALSLSQGTLALFPEPLVNGFLVSVENYAHILFWIIATDAASSMGWPPCRAFAVGLLSCSAAGLLWSIFLEHQMRQAESAVFVVFYLLVIGCIVYPQAIHRTNVRSASEEDVLNAFALHGEQRLTPGINGSALQEALEQRCAHLAREYALSPREEEVLVLLVKGLTRQTIGRTLHLSEGTVKTHLAHIYGKFDVHSQGELLGIAYAAGDSNPVSANGDNHKNTP